jgi:Uma2 family endonuclease
MSETLRLVTAEELEKFPDDGYRYELVEGRVIRMSPVGLQHARTVAQLVYLLQRHLHGRGLGLVLPELGVKLASNPDTVRAPDVAFLRQDRIPANARGFWVGPPDLAVEVLSPGDRPAEVQEKVDEYLRRGTALVVVIDPENKTVTIFRPSIASTTLRSEDDLLDLDAVVPGFRCRLGEIFE